MALRRPSWSSACLCHFRARVDPPRRWIKSGEVERRRNLASLAQDGSVGSLARPLNHSALSTSGASSLDELLFAIQRKDAYGTGQAFFAWTHALSDESSPAHRQAIDQFDNLPSPVMSEILRNMDPVSHPELDVAHSLRITQGHVRFTDLGKHMDEYGIRHHHRRVLRGIEIIVQRRKKTRFPLRPADFVALLRMAGASMDHHLSSFMLELMEGLELAKSRNSDTRTEYLKARFMTDPLYYHHDRARMVVTPRSLVTDVIRWPEERKAIVDMERIRFSNNAFTRQPWSRAREHPDKDIRHLIRGRGSHESFVHDWVRIHNFPQDINEELLAVSIEAFSRSYAREAILDDVLKTYYGIEIDEANQNITGGFDIPKDSPIYPTSRLQFALVEAFGAMGEISLGMQLVDFVSQRYGVSITPETWSSLLSWTYIHAHKTLHNMRKASKVNTQESISSMDVLHVWNIMTSPPYNIQPSFDDFDVYVKVLIVTKNLNKAVKVIRETALPYYRSINEEFENAIMDEVLMNDTMADPQPSHPDGAEPTLRPTPYTSSAFNAAHQRRLRAETLKDYVNKIIATWFDEILRKASNSAAHRSRSSTFTIVTIPNLIRDFGDFFLSGARYRTATGEVRIHWGIDEMRRFDGTNKQRTTLPQKLAGRFLGNSHVDVHGNPRFTVDPGTGDLCENPDYVWPMIEQLTIRETRPVPKMRAARFGIPPKLGDDPKRKIWWGKFESQLML